MRYIDDFRSAGFEIFIDKHCYRIDKRSGANKLFFNIISNTDEWQTLNNTEQFASAVKMKRFVRIEEYISAHSKTVRTRDLEPFEITEGGYITQMSESEWILSIDVYDLRGVGRFCMGLLKHIKITDTPQLKEYLLSEYEILTE